MHELCTLKPLFLGGSDKETQQKVRREGALNVGSVPSYDILPGKLVVPIAGRAGRLTACTSCRAQPCRCRSADRPSMHASPCNDLQVLSGAMPPPPARYSPELRALVSGMLQQSPAERPTIDDLLHSTAVRGCAGGNGVLLVLVVAAVLVDERKEGSPAAGSSCCCIGAPALTPPTIPPSLYPAGCRAPGAASRGASALPC